MPLRGKAKRDDVDMAEGPVFDAWYGVVGRGPS
jgi:hypothetical protein